MVLMQNGSILENHTSDVHEPPEIQSSDYGEIALLALLLCIGGPLNILSFYRSLRDCGYVKSGTLASIITFRRMEKSTGLGQRRASHFASDGAQTLLSSNTTKRRSSSARHISSRLLTLKLHLTTANLLIVCGYGFSQIIWLATYSWKGGDVLCKCTKFLHTFCFYATSNLVASIAIDRLHVTLYVDRPDPAARRRSSTVTNRTWLARSTWVAWTLAFISSLPQFFLWRTFAPFKSSRPDWEQCVTVWAAAVTENSAELSQDSLATIILYERVYAGLHLTLIFWIPVLVVVACYALILAQLHRKISMSHKDLSHVYRLGRNGDPGLFRRRCEYMHRASICSADSNSDHGRPSPGMLMELPIVISSAQPFLVQPLIESFAVLTLTKAKKRTVRNTVWILVAYMICWSPYNILETYRLVIDPEYENVGLELLSNLIVLNAVVNPLIYGL